MIPSPAFPTTVPELACETLHLRALTEADIPAWFARATDAESADLAGDTIPASIDRGTAWLERHREQFRRQAAIRWAILPTGAGHSVGTIGLAITLPTAELGLVIARTHWNRGLATAAAQLVLQYAATHLAPAGLIAEIRAEVLQRNPASQRLMEKLGFRLLRTIPDADPYNLYALPMPRENK